MTPDLLLIILYLAPAVWFTYRLLTKGTMAELYGLLMYLSFFATITLQRLHFSTGVVLAGGIAALELMLYVTRARKVGRTTGADYALIGLVGWSVLAAFFHSSGTTIIGQLGIVLAILLLARFRPAFSAKELNGILLGLALGGLATALACVIERGGSHTLYGLLNLRRDYAEGTANR